MDEVVQQLLGEVHRVFTENQTLTDEILSALNFVFQSQLLSALDLVDRRCVTQLSSPSGRQLFRVTGSSGTPYICFTTNEYCECPAYRFSVLQKEHALMCKHVLAAKLSDAMGLVTVQSVTDEHMSALLKAMN